MANYRLSRAASGDVDYLYEDGIIRYGMQQADQYFDGLIAQFEFLAGNPRVGKNSQELAANLQRFRYRRHMIFFTITDNSILIIRVLGEEMDFQRHL